MYSSRALSWLLLKDFAKTENTLSAVAEDGLIRVMKLQACDKCGSLCTRSLLHCM